MRSREVIFETNQFQRERLTKNFFPLQITFGRTTKEQTVDVDLTLEGPAYKVSRKQGTIKLRSNGDFFISNEGKRPIYIDGMPLLSGSKNRINNNCVIEVRGGVQWKIRKFVNSILNSRLPVCVSFSLSTMS